MRKAMPSMLVLFATLATGATTYAECVCKTAKIQNGWCQDCSVGYVAGVKISSKKLYDALEGKQFADASAIKCNGCKEALAADGKCGHCHVGFANKSAYKAMPAYSLARGQAMNPDEMKCAGCRAHASDHGWCDHCNAGLVGYRAFKDKDAYNEAVKAREVLLAAVDQSKKCETCAVAMVTDGTCSSCAVSFKDGKMTTPAGEKETKPDKP